MKKMLPKWISEKYLSADSNSINSSIMTTMAPCQRGVLRYNLANMKEIKRFMNQV